MWRRETDEKKSNLYDKSTYSMSKWYEVSVDSKAIKKEREKAQKLKKSQWWRNKISLGLCHYCGQKFSPDMLTMDHVVPVERGGKSVPGNVVPSCKK